MFLREREREPLSDSLKKEHMEERQATDGTPYATERILLPPPSANNDMPEQEGQVGDESNNGDNVNKEEDQVQVVLTKPPPLRLEEDNNAAATAEREQRRKRRRQLKRMIQKSQGYPSFFSLLTANYDSNNDGRDFEDDLEKYVVIVKQEKKNVRQTAAAVAAPVPDISTSSIKVPAEITASAGTTNNFSKERPAKRVRLNVDSALANIKMGGSAAMAIRVDDDDDDNDTFPATATFSTTIRPADQGFYEGIVSPISLPEDEAYLPPLQAWTRRNLEFFSATIQDASTLQPGRRSISVGRVGVRCIHCARAVLQSSPPPAAAASDAPVPDESFSSHQQPSPQKTMSAATNTPKSWPLAAVSYPANLAGLHAICSQKPQLHFEQNCPYLPPEERAELQRLQMTTGSGGGSGGSSNRPSLSSRDKVTLAMYYMIACKRIGLVDNLEDNNDGIRFGRDLFLEPLPFDTIRRQCEQQQQQEAVADVMVATTATAPRITADEESERVLAEAVAEKDDLTTYLCTSQDKVLLTDFMFLTIKQARICHASPWDMTFRGKKTRGLRLGWAGFCCRHCATANGGPPSSTTDTSRSFASQPDNLVSAISNSFAAHLQRCYKVPQRIKKALTAYKKLHQRQMAQLQHGSQRKLVNELWIRMRSVDKTEEEMQEILKDMPKYSPPEQSPPSLGQQWSSGSEIRRKTALSSTIPASRPESYPTCDNPETQDIIARFENDWNPEANDGLIRPGDRYLVSDFVFLTMRQLKATLPTLLETAAGKRSSRLGIAGLSCIHCDGKDEQVSPSGRSFPSAPDNYASCLNTGFFNHMQNCYYIPDDLKRALVNTRKIHSLQCSSLRFGSQRKYFNILFSRINDYFKANYDEAAFPAITLEQALKRQSDSVLQSQCSEYGFLEVPSRETPSRSMYVCTKCRMVPIQFRAEGSVFFSRPKDFKMKEHSQACKEDALDLSRLAAFLEKGVQDHCKGIGVIQVTSRESFKDLVRAVVRNDRLAELFTNGVQAVLDGQCSGDNARDSSKGLWRDLPCNVDLEKVTVAFERFASDHSDLVGKSLHQCPGILGYLQLISPSIAVSGDSNREGKKSETNDEDPAAAKTLDTLPTLGTGLEIDASKKAVPGATTPVVLPAAQPALDTSTGTNERASIVASKSESSKAALLENLLLPPVRPPSPPPPPGV